MRKNQKAGPAVDG